MSAFSGEGLSLEHRSEPKLACCEEINLSHFVALQTRGPIAARQCSEGWERFSPLCNQEAQREKRMDRKVNLITVYIQTVRLRGLCVCVYDAPSLVSQK